ECQMECYRNGGGAFLRLPTLSILFLLLALSPPVAAAQSGPGPRLDVYGDPLPPGAIARLGTTRLHHSGQILALAFSPDESKLFSAGGDKTVRVWSTSDGRLLLRFDVPELATAALSK